MREPPTGNRLGVRWVGLVRNVMVGREGLTKDVLVQAALAAGGGDVRSVLGTGNVVFTAPAREARDIVEVLERTLAEVLCRPTMVALRSERELGELLRVDRFADVDQQSLQCEVTFLRHEAPPLVPHLLGDPGRTVLVEVRAREVLAARPASGPRRPHATRLVEAATGQPATARGWATLQRLLEAARS